MKSFDRSFCQNRAVPAWNLVKLPEKISANLFKKPALAFA